MVNKNSFSCFIVGDDNLTLQCAEIILSNKHQLLGIISASNNIKKWCATHSIHCISSIEEFEDSFKNHPFDFLFSIVNSQILPKRVLNLPLQYAINYHNSPLPKYAGLYATSWAILNGETEHAISWHKMEEVVDAGSILKQPSFPIEEKDTALSLNLKCFEHAVSSFRELVDELSSNKTCPTPQDLNNRSYYGLKNKPTDFGFISWENSAEEIDRLCRALTFGHYTNELATPKIIIKNKVFIINSHKKTNQSSGLKPGNIVSISNKSIQIATKTTDITLLKLTDLNGNQQAIDTLAHQFDLKANTPINSINKDVIKKLRASPAKNPKMEKFWLKSL